MRFSLSNMLQFLCFICLIFCPLLVYSDHDVMSPGELRSVRMFKSAAAAKAHIEGYTDTKLSALRGSNSKFRLTSADSISSSLVVLVPDVTSGPYPESLTDYVNTNNLLAAAIAGAAGVTSNRTSVLNGVPMSLSFNIYNVSGTIATPIVGAAVYIWHCDALGIYSAVALASAPQNQEDTTGQKWLRAYQTTDSNGAVSFSTIVPGWYTPRAVHFHIRVRLADAATNQTWAVTTQLFPNQTLQNGLKSLSPYSGDTQSLSTIAADQIYTSVASSLASELILNTTGSYTSGFSTTFNLGIESSSASTSTTTASPTTTATTTTTATATATTTGTAASNTTTTTTATTAPSNTKSSSARPTMHIGAASTVLMAVLSATFTFIMAMSQN